MKTMICEVCGKAAMKYSDRQQLSISYYADDELVFLCRTPDLQMDLCAECREKISNYIESIKTDKARQLQQDYNVEKRGH